jgi:hypothetical protein
MSLSLVPKLNTHTQTILFRHEIQNSYTHTHKEGSSKDEENKAFDRSCAKRPRSKDPLGSHVKTTVASGTRSFVGHFQLTKLIREC